MSAARIIRYSDSIIDYLYVIWRRNPITGLENAEFTKTVVVDGAVVVIPITVTEIDSVGAPGLYRVDFDSPATGKTMIVTISNATYLPTGQAAHYDMSTSGLTPGGANVVTIKVVDQDGDALPDVSVTIRNEDQTAVMVAAISTDSNGEVVVGLDNGEYKVLLRKAGVTFTVPETLVVSGDTSDEYAGSLVDIEVPTAAEEIVIYGYTTDIIGRVVDNYELEFVPIGENLYTKGGVLIDTTKRKVYSDETGFFSVYLIKTSEIDISKSTVREARYRLTHGPNQETRDFQTPDAQSVNIADLEVDTDGTVI
jgi:hypothetical protein